MTLITWNEHFLRLRSLLCEGRGKFFSPSLNFETLNFYDFMVEYLLNPIFFYPLEQLQAHGWYLDCIHNT